MSSIFHNFPLAAKALVSISFRCPRPLLSRSPPPLALSPRSSVYSSCYPLLFSSLYIALFLSFENSLRQRISLFRSPVFLTQPLASRHQLSPPLFLSLSLSFSLYVSHLSTFSRLILLFLHIIFPHSRYISRGHTWVSSISLFTSVFNTARLSLSLSLPSSFSPLASFGHLL